MTNTADPLSREDLRILHQALNEILNGPEAIEEWEFETRMGAKRDQAAALLDRVGKHLENVARG